MEKEFHFVAGFNPDRATKKSIRSHAMRGKNVGKTLHRSRLNLSTRRRQETYSSYSSFALALGDTNFREGRSVVAASEIAIPKNLGNIFLTCSLPVELKTSSLYIINQFFCHVAERMYPLYLGLSPDEAKSMWLRMMFTDETASRCNIALMDACNEFFLGGNPSSPQGLRYLSQALNLVNQRIQSNEALDDSTLSLVVSLVLREEMRNERLASEIHYAGLRRMIELRGGLSQLEGNLPLLLKICKMDISYGLHYGGSIRFFRDCMPVKLQNHGLDTTGVTVSHENLDPLLKGILSDAMRMAVQLNQIPNQPVFAISTFQEMVISIGCRLVRFQPLNGPWRCSRVESAYHVTLTIFMMTLFLQCDGRRVWHYSLVSRRLNFVLENESVGVDEIWNDLRLWMMFMGGIWVLADTHEDWLFQKLRALVRHLRIRDYDGVLRRISKFPWINALHDRPGRDIWEQIDSEQL